MSRVYMMLIQIEFMYQMLKARRLYIMLPMLDPLRSLSFFSVREQVIYFLSLQAFVIYKKKGFHDRAPLMFLSCDSVDVMIKP